MKAATPNTHKNINASIRPMEYLLFRENSPLCKVTLFIERVHGSTQNNNEVITEANDPGNVKEAEDMHAKIGLEG